MPGFELFGDAERKEVNDVLDSGVLMRYGFDGMRQGHWKAKELEHAIQSRFEVNHAQLLIEWNGCGEFSTRICRSGCWR